MASINQVEGSMPDFIKNLEDCVIVDGNLICFDEIREKLVMCEVKPISDKVPKKAIIAYAKKQMEKE